MDKQMLLNLTLLPRTVWEKYGMKNEPLKRFISPQLQAKLFCDTHDSAEKLAAQVKSQFPDKKPSEIITSLGLEVKVLNSADTENYVTFACFNEPSNITIYIDAIKKANDMLEQNTDLADILGEFDITEILLAHEIYHYYESKHYDLFSSQKHVTLFKLGKWKYKANISSLGEIAAMSFAKALTGISFSPFILDVVLLYSHNSRMALELYKYIMALSN